jgi:hypothetical protein
VDYSVIFYGHLRRGPLTDGLPARIETGATYRTVPKEEHERGLSEKAQIESFIDGMAINLARSSGMYAEFDMPDDVKSDKEWGRGKLVPWHMIRYMSYAVRKITGGTTPDVNDPKVVLN